MRPIDERVIDVLERLTRDGPKGHPPHPITDPAHVELQRRLNASRYERHEGDPYSLRWFCCRGDADRLINPNDPDQENGRRWGDVWHDAWQAHQDAVALLAELRDDNTNAPTLTMGSVIRHGNRLFKIIGLGGNNDYLRMSFRPISVIEDDE